MKTWLINFIKRQKILHTSSKVMEVKRGEVWYANLTQEGSVQGGKRPCVIIQNDIGNKYSPTTIIAPLTSKKKKMLPVHILLTTQHNSIVLLEQVRTINKSQLMDKIGTVGFKDMENINNAIKISLGL